MLSRASATHECIHLCVYMPLRIYGTLTLRISYVTFRPSKRSTFRRSGPPSEPPIPLHTILYHYIPLRTIPLHYITLHYITLHYTTLHYITLHTITYIHIYIYIHNYIYIYTNICLYIYTVYTYIHTSQCILYYIQPWHSQYCMLCSFNISPKEHLSQSLRRPGMAPSFLASDRNTLKQIMACKDIWVCLIISR